MCFANFSFQFAMTLIIFYLFLIFNLFSKFLLTDICLPFTFYFTFFLYFSFQNCFLLFRITIFLLTMSYSLCPLEPAIPPQPLLLVRLFSVCAVVPILLLFWGVTEFQDTYHGFLYFISFLCGFLYCWCERNTGKHFIGFY